MNFPCKLFFESCAYCELAMRIRVEDVQSQAARHHPRQDQLLHEVFYSKWHLPDNPFASCCNDADCYPTEIKFVDGNIHAERQGDVNYISVPPERVERNKDNSDGRNHLSAPSPNVFSSDTVFCFALGGAT